MSHDTNTCILQEVKKARDHVGAPPLRLLQTDNPEGEQAPYYTIFPELKEGIVARSLLPSIEIPQTDIAVLDDATAINHYILTFAESFPGDTDIYYGLDTEFERDGQKLTVLSLAFPQSIIGVPVTIVIHLHKIAKRDFPNSLKRLLEQHNMIPTGRLIGGDCKKLEDQFGVLIQRRMELYNLCRSDRDIERYGLKDLMEEYLLCTYPMNKSDAQLSSYAKAKLSPTDVQYCALDAVVSLWVCHRALALLAQGGQLVDPHPTLQVGKHCIVTHNTKDIAAGTLWHLSWPQKTLGELKRSLHTFELAVKVNQIKILLDDHQPSCTPAMVGNATVQPFQVDKSYLDGLLQEHQASNNSTPMMPMQEMDSVDIIVQEDDTEDRAAAGLEAEMHKDSETGLLLTKSVRDLFHQFHNIPLSKKADEAAHVCQFLLAATWINDEDDYANVAEVVLSKGETDLAFHEFFQREYWRKRVRRNTPLPKDHANNI
ncbi:unnamed protein product [Cylindrotheca closterium]|uniref:3'-5' exonuclease n=1 Tax=Cylindrotheca closterium TaxID=2856 RepID=A0AAD2FCV7_9STRA|nr:unnamed protein product [Cylindrotheca closterium]